MNGPGTLPAGNSGGADVTVAGMRLRSPVLVASGCGGTGRELAAYGALSSLGAFVTRTVTTDPRPGAPAGCVVETPSGLAHATGMPNPGVDNFLATELPWLVAQDVRVIVSVAAQSVVDASRLAVRVGGAPGVSAVEVILAPTSDPVGDLYVAYEPFEAASVVDAVQRELPPGVPLLAKLRCEQGRVVEIVRAVSDAGAAAVVLGDAQPAVLPDRRPAGLSGPGIRPLALRCVHDVRQALPHVDVVGCGGVATPADVRAFLDAGASAVAVGTALLHDPTTAHRLVEAHAHDLRDEAVNEPHADPRSDPRAHPQDAREDRR